MTDVKSVKQNTEKLIEKVARNETSSNKYIILQIQKALSYYLRVIKFQRISKTEKDDVNALIQTALKCLNNVTLSEENLTVDDTKPSKLWQLAVQQTVMFIKEKKEILDEINYGKLNPNDYETWLKTTISHAQQLESFEENEQILNTKKKLSIFFLELFICSPPDDSFKKSDLSHATGMNSKNYENEEKLNEQFHEMSYRRQNTNNINDGRNLPAPDYTENGRQIYETSRRSNLDISDSDDEIIDSEEVSPNRKRMWTVDFGQERSADSANVPSSETSEEETTSIEIGKEEKEPLPNDYNFQEELKSRKVSTIKDRIGSTIQKTLQKKSSIPKSETAHIEQINKSLNILTFHDENDKNSPRPTPKPRRNVNIAKEIEKKTDLKNIESYLQKFKFEVQKVNYPPWSKKYTDLHNKINNLLEETEAIHMEDEESKHIIMGKIRTLLETLQQKALRYQECWNILDHIANEIESVKCSDSLTVDKLTKLQECKDLINSELTSDLDDEILCEKNHLMSGIKALENEYNKNIPFENDMFYASIRVKKSKP